jgi:hypothetical protein
MTPVIFVSFLVSLLVVDLRYSAMRSHYHPEEYSTSLPRWLHRIVYSYQPYQYVRVDKDRNQTRERVYHGFYHSKQRKLMKMEVDDAFQIRGTVLFVMGILVMMAIWAMCSVTTLTLRTMGIW